MEEIDNLQDYRDFLKLDLAGIYYYTDNCGVCKVLKPKVKTLFKQMNLPLSGMNLMKHASLSAQQLIMGVPTLIVYYKGKELMREGAYMQLMELEKKLIRISKNH